MLEPRFGAYAGKHLNPYHFCYVFYFTVKHFRSIFRVYVVPWLKQLFHICFILRIKDGGNIYFRPLQAETKFPLNYLLTTVSKYSPRDA